MRRVKFHVESVPMNNQAQELDYHAFGDMGECINLYFICTMCLFIAQWSFSCRIGTVKQ